MVAVAGSTPLASSVRYRSSAITFPTVVAGTASVRWAHRQRCGNAVDSSVDCSGGPSITRPTLRSPSSGVYGVTGIDATAAYSLDGASGKGLLGSELLRVTGAGIPGSSSCCALGLRW